MKRSDPRSETEMQVVDSYSVVVTPRHKECRDFYAYDLREEPWGQRRFALRDPSGTWIDVVQQIEPEPGFWDPYVRIVF